MSKYVYDSNGAYIETFFDEVSDNDILNIYPNSFIETKFLEFTKIVNGNLLSMDIEEIKSEKYKRYIENEYTLKSNEIIVDNKIMEVELKDFEYIENGILKFNFNDKREYLINKTKTYEINEKEKEFEFKEYMQPNRELEDQTSLLKILSFMQMTKQTHFDAWKMKDKEGHERYVSLTIQEMMQLGQMMQSQTTQAMVKWSKIREDIKSMSDEELKTYEIQKE